MPRYFLRFLSIEGFRGINNEGDPLTLAFDPDKVNSVFAPNGIGKSSIFDALQYAIQGRVRRLDALLSEESPSDYANNLFHSSKSATIDLTLAPDDGSPDVKIRVRRLADGTRSVTSPSGYHSPNDLLADLNKEFTLLDYQTFQDFINYTSLERGRSFSPLLGLSPFARTRRALQAAADTRTLNSDFDIKAIRTSIERRSEQVLQLETSMANLYEAILGRSPNDRTTIATWPTDAVDGLRQIDLLRPSMEDFDSSPGAFVRLRQKVASAEGSEARSHLAKLVEHQTRLEALGESDSQDISDSFERVQDSVRELEEAVTYTRGARTKRLFDCAHEVLISSEWTEELQCPLCESSLAEPLSSHISDALGQYERVNRAAVNIRELLRESIWAQRVARLDSSPDISTGQEPIITILIREVESFGITRSTLATAQGHLNQLELSRRTQLASLRSEIDEMRSAIPSSLVELTAQIDRVENLVGSYRNLAANEKEREREENKLRAYERWIAYVQRVSRAYGRAEAKLSADVLEELEQSYQTMFNRVMGVEDVTPSLTRDDSGENLGVDLEEFHGVKDVSARAVLSESSRNALAISVYLSAARRQTAAPRFIVLDDVTSSFDAGHQFHLMEYIRTELQQPDNPDGMQFILLSHDVMLEKYFDRVSNEGCWKHQKLHGRPPFAAVSATEQRSDRLKKRADEFVSIGQLDSASGVLRQYLEFVLVQIITRMGIPVPIDLAVKEQRRMVQDCLNAIRSHIDLLQKAGTPLALDSKQVSDITSVHVPAIVGNLMSHYSTAGASQFNPSALSGVIRNIEKLEACFKFEDPAGSGHFRWYKSLTKRK